MPKPLRFALIGCGQVGPAHARSLNQIDDAELVVTCSRTEANVKAFAAEHGCEWTTDFESILARDDIDIIDITTPPWCHEQQVTAAAKAGKHVILEKPIAGTLDEGERIIHACRHHGVTLGVIFQNRWRKSFALLKREIEAGSLGDLLLGDAYVKWFRPQDYYDQDAWRGTRDGEGGGVLINQGIHAIDSLQWLMGPIDWLFGQVTTTQHHDIETEDLGIATLRFANGAMGVIEAATALKPGLPDRLEIHGTKGTVVVEGGKIAIWDVEGQDEEAMKATAEEETGSGASDPMAFPIAWHTQQLEDFIGAVRNNGTPAVDGAEGLKALHIVQAIYRSSESGTKVTF